MYEEEDLILQYFRTMTKWFITSPPVRVSMPGAPVPRALHLHALRTMMEIAKADLTPGGYAGLTAIVFDYQMFPPIPKKVRIVYPPTAWGKYWTCCVLCGTTKRLHCRQGRCTGCWKATVLLSRRVNALRTRNPTKEQT